MKQLVSGQVYIVGQPRIRRPFSSSKAWTETGEYPGAPIVFQSAQTATTDAILGSYVTKAGDTHLYTFGIYEILEASAIMELLDATDQSQGEWGGVFFNHALRGGFKPGWPS